MIIRCEGVIVSAVSDGDQQLPSGTIMESSSCQCPGIRNQDIVSNAMNVNYSIPRCFKVLIIFFKYLGR